MLRVLDLFSGIGGFSIGLERAGMQTVAFCEADSFCRQLIAERWPGIDCYHDVKKLDATKLIQSHGRIDVICGGFPCQDISAAGNGAGITGARSGLWKHFARLIRDIQPRWVVIENVSNLRNNGLETVLGDLAAIGYDAEWHCIPASYLGAPHRRDRIWIVANPYGRRCESHRIQEHAQQPSACGIEFDGCGSPGWRQGTDMGDANGARLQIGTPADANGSGRIDSRRTVIGPGWWDVEPAVGRMADGIPYRMDRLKALGNAIIPAIAEMIGHAIMAAE